jgi:hypothetical protein
MSQEPDTSHELHIDLSTDSRETFIPLRHNDLYLRLMKRFEMSPLTAASFRSLFEQLQSIFHVEHLAALVRIEDLYSPFDPDDEQIQETAFSQSELKSRMDRLFDSIANLAYAAHYQRLSRDELERMIKLSSRAGVKLQVDFDIFERLEIFARGYRLVEVKQRRWQNFFRERTITLPEFHRLILAFRLRGGEAFEKRKVDKTMSSDAVYIKNFKNIPETDLEILLPGTRVKFSTLDRGIILLPTITGMAPSIYKFVRGLILVGLTATIVSTWGMFLVVAALIGYSIKSVFAYFRTRDKYEFNLTKNLYLKNLDNNVGVLYRVLNEAEEQELCETTLGYAVLWKFAGEHGLEELELDRLAEEFLLAETNIDVDFDLHDALGKLARLGLATVDAAGRWKATPIETASVVLIANWERMFENRKQGAINLQINARR